MKKVLLRAILIASLPLLITPMAMANSTTYKISVTIPVIPGFNAPPFTESQKLKTQHKGLNGETIREEIWRNQQKIILETIVAD